MGTRCLPLALPGINCRRMANSTAKLKPHYHGHRGRLRDKLINHGPHALADYELLELVLGVALPRRDVKPLAKELLAKFGGLSNLLAASPGELAKFEGVGDSVIGMLKAQEALVLRYRREVAQDRPRMDSTAVVVEYLQARMNGLQHEVFHVLALDNKYKLVADEELFRGTINATAVYPREVVKLALQHGAAALIIAHNHPSGDSTPSDDDHLLTRELMQICASMGVELVDHLVIGEGAYYSFRAHGQI